MSIKRAFGALLGAATAVVLLGATRGGLAQQDAEPCCGIVAVDGARGVITLKDKSGRFTFHATLVDVKQAAVLRAGQAVSLSGESKTLFVAGVGAQAARDLRIADVRFGGFSPSGSPGAVGSAASSTPVGKFTRQGNNKRCPKIKESATEQCVLTHETPSMCEYYCVPINNK
jgi:hypothetical protein